jgi:pyruvate/2-oxoglutarate dehydrogenase complex dihydrolipoamide dehydrogenase (E3) component
MVKSITTYRSKILGCGIFGKQAGELIQSWVLALAKGMKIGHIAQTTAPYPTLGEISKRYTGNYFTPSLYSPKIRKIVLFLAWFG